MPTFTVTTTADSGIGSLRAAIAAANASPGSTIVFDPAFLPANATITLASALPAITADVTIDGSGVSGLKISGGNAVRVFFVQSGNVTIENLAIADGNAQGGDGGGPGGGGGLGAGGAIFVNAGTTTVANVTFTNNHATGGDGAAGANGNAGGGGGGLNAAGGDAPGGTVGGDGGGPFGGSGAGVFGTGGDASGDFSGGGGGGPGGGGGDGGFGGGGGSAGSTPDGFGTEGGFGGFGGGGGGGGGGGPGFGGFLAGSGGGGSAISGDTGAGGGGAAFGGAIFVRGGANLVLKDGSFGGSQIAGGSGGGGDATDGSRMGSDLFLAGARPTINAASTATFAPDAGKTLYFSGTVRDDGPEGGVPPSLLETVGTGASLTIGDGTSTGTVVMGSVGAINWLDVTAIATMTFKSGTLELAGRAAGTLTFSAGAQTLQIDDAAFYPSSTSIGVTLKSFGTGDIIRLADMAFVAGASASFSAGTMTVTSGSGTATLVLSTPSATSFGVRDDGTAAHGTLVFLDAAPTDMTLSPASVPENSAAGTLVGTLSAVDTDAGDSATFAFVSGTGSADNGLFEIVGNELRVKTGTQLNFEQTTTYSVRVRGTDSGGLFFEKAFTVGVTNQNEAPTDIALAPQSVAENSTNGTVVGALGDTDPDAGDSASYTLLDDAGGRFTISGTSLVVANGALLDHESSSSHQVTVHVVDGGGLSTDKIFTIGVTNVNEAPTDIALASSSVAENSQNGTVVGALSDTDPDAGDSAIYTLLDDAGGRFAISGSNLVVANGALLDHESSTSHQVTIRVADGGGLAFDKVLTIGVTDVDEAIYLTPGDDSFTAPAGDVVVHGLGGVDTIAFGFRLVDATVSYVGNTIVIDSQASHTVTTGFERFVFTDGTVDNADGNRLVDDLFYYSRNHDVWNAHADADFHYGTTGWKEGRDPDAFFDTSIYLSANPDVAASGVNPLTHYDTIGWQQGRVPSLAFDGRAYLDANPDVAAAGMDPLFHFLVAGASEGRQPIAPAELATANGFDFVYYLANNPDVAAAGVDPFWHFQNIGWHEGRNPNAWFDTAGYLAAYTDVAAAHVNPLDHYNMFGWHEGRDPSLAFDTQSYLTANPDVAAAHVNPLVHFLQTGHYEGRSAIADGVWG
jgi:hypothetical protein